MKKLMKRAISVFLAVSILAILVGCSTEKQDTPNDPAQSEQTVMKVAVATAPANFNPFASTAGSVFQIYGKTQVYDTLFTHDAEGNIFPSIAESYTVSDDNLTITFKLHEGVTFSNGEKFTSADAKYSLDVCRETKLTATYFTAIDSIDAPDEYTIVMHLNTPNAALFENLTVYGQMVCKSAHEQLGDEYGMSAETTIGTGPYTVKDFIPEQSVTYIANENYFKGSPNIKEVDVQSIVNEESAIIALQTGEIDYYMNAVPAISVEKIKADPNLELVDIVSKKLYYICLNCERGPFADTNMRKAISLAINRDDLNMIITEGLGTVVYYPGYPTNTGNPDINDKVAYKQNIEEATRLIEAAGYKGATVTACMENNAILQQFATALQSQLSAVGLNVQINMMEYTSFMEDVFKNGNYDLTTSYNTAKTGDMDLVWTNWMSSAKVGSGNTARYVNPKMDELLAIARSEMDPETRKQDYVDCINLYLEDLPLLPITYEYSSRVYNNQKLVIENGLVEQDNFYNFSWK